jgi:ribosomal protein S18 acetylase RimI-like enzyme
MYLIRPALPEDATALAALAERTFRATFAADNRAEDMDAHCRATYSPLRQAEEITRADGLTLLATTNGALIGFIQVRWGAAPSCIASTLAGEVQRLYVDTPWHGKGVANALLSDALTVLREQHLEHVWLGVWEHNPRARAFYRKCGFIDVGEHVFQLGDDPQRDVLMARRLD